MSPFYAPFSLETDGLDVCSDCGSLVSRAARALHDKVCAGKPKVEVTPGEQVMSTIRSAQSRRSLERRELFDKAERDGVLEQYRTPSGRVSYKWHCTVCGAQGGGPRTDGEPPIGAWWVACAEGHPYGCVCGRRFATMGGRRVHVRSMQRNHPEQQHAGVSA